MSIDPLHMAFEIAHRICDVKVGARGFRVVRVFDPDDDSTKLYIYRTDVPAYTTPGVPFGLQGAALRHWAEGELRSPFEDRVDWSRCDESLREGVLSIPSVSPAASAYVGGLCLCVFLACLASWRPAFSFVLDVRVAHPEKPRICGGFPGLVVSGTKSATILDFRPGTTTRTVGKRQDDARFTLFSGPVRSPL